MFGRFTREAGVAFAIALVAIGLGLAILAPATGSAQTPPSAAIKQITLTTGEEVPPVTANVTGFFSGTLRDGAFDYDISADGANFTMAHLHMAAKGVNGGVVVPFFNDPKGQPSIHLSGTITVKDLTGALANNWDGFVAALAAGNIYANVHSDVNPGGVARAQLPPTSLPSTSLTATPAPPKVGSGTVSTASWSGSVLFASALTVAGVVLLGYAFSRRHTG
jgi:CHRD domain